MATTRGGPAASNPHGREHVHINGVCPDKPAQRPQEPRSAYDDALTPAEAQRAAADEYRASVWAQAEREDDTFRRDDPQGWLDDQLEASRNALGRQRSLQDERAKAPLAVQQLPPHRPDRPSQTTEGRRVRYARALVKQGRFRDIQDALDSIKRRA